MKLYGNITSEKGTKGQGGNDYLDIEITTPNQQIAKIHLHEDAEQGIFLDVYRGSDLLFRKILPLTNQQRDIQHKGTGLKGTKLKEKCDVLTCESKVVHKLCNDCIKA